MELYLWKTQKDVMLAFNKKYVISWQMVGVVS